MPIICNVPLPEDEVEEYDEEKGSPCGEILTTRPYRFSGYHIVRDTDGNILFSRRHSSQPAYWSFRAIAIHRMDAKAP